MWSTSCGRWLRARCHELIRSHCNSGCELALSDAAHRRRRHRVLDPNRFSALGEPIALRGGARVPPSGTAPIPAAASVVYHIDSPFPWSTLPVTGRLLFITYDPQVSTTSMPVPLIALLDLATGDVTAVWRPPENAWLSGMDLAPDRTKLAIAYASPPEEGNFQSGRPGVYLLPGDCLALGLPQRHAGADSRSHARSIPTSGPFGPWMERASTFPI